MSHSTVTSWRVLVVAHERLCSQTRNAQVECFSCFETLWKLLSVIHRKAKVLESLPHKETSVSLPVTSDNVTQNAEHFCEEFHMA
jgi:hypothetical protein